MNTATPGSAPSHAIVVARGSLYLSRELCDAYLTRVTSVALIVREGVIQIVPLNGDSAGGLLLKHRNARGDRVVHAQEFLRDNGYPESSEARTLSVHWNRELASLSIDALRHLKCRTVLPIP